MPTKKAGTPAKSAVSRKATAKTAPPRRGRVQAAETGMAVLRGLTQLGGRGAISALAVQIGENPAKVHRYLQSLMVEGFVVQDPATLQYFLGPAAVQLGIAAMRQADPLRVAAPALLRVRESLDATCFLAVMGNLGPTIVRMEEPALPVTINVRVGSVLPLLWSSTGRAFLGFTDDPGMQARATRELAAAPADRRDQLGARDPIARIRRQAREHGVATVRDTYLPGISAVSAPVYDHAGHLAAVLTALGATGGFDASPGGRPAAVLREEARSASGLLGYTQAA